MTALEVLKMYEVWEADLIIRDDCEQVLDSLPDDMYNRLIELQTHRNEVFINEKVRKDNELHSMYDRLSQVENL